MTSTAPAAGSAAAPWTCPFCPLLCDTYTVAVEPGADALQLIGGDCPKAIAALRHFGPGRSSAVPSIDGQAVDLDRAVAEAARLFGAARQPLFGGLATDVAGARALYRLACRTGAIGDHAGGAALTRSTRALQDKGAFTTTLAEIAERADLVVCIGTDPGKHYPGFFRRCKLDTPALSVQGERPRHVVYLGDTPLPAALVATPGITSEHVPLFGDLHDTATALAAAVAGRAVRGFPASLASLAKRLVEANYAVLVWETAQLGTHGGLVIEALNRVVSTLNRSTRAAAFALGGGDGSASVNQTLTWLSGLPLRSRVGPAGLEHEPYAFDTDRLLAAGAVDALLWISSFGPKPAVPGTSLPTVVLGHPDVAAPARGVFIPVATPGIGTAGHLFRVDSSSVLMPLHAVLDQGLPTVADVLGRIDAALAGKEPSPMNLPPTTTTGVAA